MQKSLLISSAKLAVMLARLSHQLLENTEDLADTVIIGLQPRGTFLAQRIADQLALITKKTVALGWLDVTFFRDDFRRRDQPLQANASNIPFSIEGKRVILIDDVLFTGRTVRSALDAMTAYGRPSAVELLVLVERKYTRELPIEAKYIGTSINSSLQERVQVNWKGQQEDQDEVWLLSPDT